MIQKRSCTLITKVNWDSYDMVKSGLIMINNVNIFTIYESLLQNVIKILPAIQHNKTKVLGKMRKFWI